MAFILCRTEALTLFFNRIAKIVNVQLCVALRNILFYDLFEDFLSSLEAKQINLVCRHKEN